MQVVIFGPAAAVAIGTIVNVLFLVMVAHGVIPVTVSVKITLPVVMSAALGK